MNTHSKKAHKAAIHFKKGQRFHQQGKLEKAKAEFKSILKLEANNFDALQSIGAVSLQQKDYPEAIRYLGLAYDINPNVSGLLCNLGLTYRHIEDGVKAENYFRQAIDNDPTFAAAHYNLALYQIAKSEYSAALLTLENAERCRPGHFPTLEQIAYVLDALSLFSKAIKYYQHALQIEPENINLLFSYGNSLQSDRRYKDAADVYRKIINLDIDNLLVRSKLAELLETMNQPAEAQQQAESILAIEPQHSLASLVLARIDRRQHKFEDAKKRLSTLIRTDFTNATDIDAALQTELGLVLDRLGEYSSAYSSFSQANKIMGKLFSADNLNRTHAFDGIKSYNTYLSSFNSNTPLQEIDDGLPSPTFLVGFPRSGTTLTEQILATSSSIVTGDELTTLHDMTTYLSSILSRSFESPDFLNKLDNTDIRKLRKHYWDLTSEGLGDDVLKRQFVDKMPLNIIHLGLIEKLFPTAKIIVALRDPRDVCLSCFMQLFQLNESMVQFLEMESTVKYYSAVMQLWLRYREHTQLQWMESRYEDIVTDVDASTKRLHDFLEIDSETISEPFHQQASERIISTPSYQDVGTPIYQRAKGRWKNYREDVDEPFKKLTPYLQAFGYT